MTGHHNVKAALMHWGYEETTTSLLGDDYVGPRQRFPRFTEDAPRNVHEVLGGDREICSSRCLSTNRDGDTRCSALSVLGRDDIFAWRKAPQFEGSKGRGSDCLDTKIVVNRRN